MKKNVILGAVALTFGLLAEFSQSVKAQIVISKQGVFSSGGSVTAPIPGEPGGSPEIGSAEYKKFLDAKVPILFLFGDYIENGPKDIQSTGFWQAVLKMCRDFTAQYNKDGGDAKVIYLPDEGIHGNSHFMFEEMNNKQIADIVADWLKQHNL